MDIRKFDEIDDINDINIFNNKLCGNYIEETAIDANFIKSNKNLYDKCEEIIEKSKNEKDEKKNLTDEISSLVKNLILLRKKNMGDLKTTEDLRLKISSIFFVKDDPDELNFILLENLKTQKILNKFYPEKVSALNNLRINELSNKNIYSIVDIYTIIIHFNKCECLSIENITESIITMNKFPRIIIEDVDNSEIFYELIDKLSEDTCSLKLFNKTHNGMINISNHNKIKNKSSNKKIKLPENLVIFTSSEYLEDEFIIPKSLKKLKIMNDKYSEDVFLNDSMELYECLSNKKYHTFVKTSGIISERYFPKNIKIIKYGGLLPDMLNLESTEKFHYFGNSNLNLDAKNLKMLEICKTDNQIISIKDVHDDCEIRIYRKKNSIDSVNKNIKNKLKIFKKVNKLVLIDKFNNLNNIIYGVDNLLINAFLLKKSDIMPCKKISIMSKKGSDKINLDYLHNCIEFLEINRYTYDIINYDLEIKYAEKNMCTPPRLLIINKINNLSNKIKMIDLNCFLRESVKFPKNSKVRFYKFYSKLANFPDIIIKRISDLNRMKITEYFKNKENDLDLMSTKLNNTIMGGFTQIKLEDKIYEYANFFDRIQDDIIERKEFIKNKKEKINEKISEERNHIKKLIDVIEEYEEEIEKGETLFRNKTNFFGEIQPLNIIKRKNNLEKMNQRELYGSYKKNVDNLVEEISMCGNFYCHEKMILNVKKIKKKNKFFDYDIKEYYKNRKINFNHNHENY